MEGRKPQEPKRDLKRRLGLKLDLGDDMQMTRRLKRNLVYLAVLLGMILMPDRSKAYGICEGYASICNNSSCSEVWGIDADACGQWLDQNNPDDWDCSCAPVHEFCDEAGAPPDDDHNWIWCDGGAS